MERGISIKTTARCQAGCPHCSVALWMRYNKGWEASIDSIRDFVKYSISSEYTFAHVSLSGGEPLLWSNLLSACKIIKEAGITTNLSILTNGIRILSNPDILFPLLDYVNFINIAVYTGTEKIIDVVREQYPGISKITCRRVYAHTVLPIKVLEGVLPAICSCDYYGLEDDRVYVCAPVKTLEYFPGISGKTFSGVSSKIGTNFLEPLKSVDRFNQVYCKICIANLRVANIQPKTEFIIRS